MDSVDPKGDNADPGPLDPVDPDGFWWILVDPGRF
jgi:hypothetical protein